MASREYVLETCPTEQAWDPAAKDGWARKIIAKTYPRVVQIEKRTRRKETPDELVRAGFPPCDPGEIRKADGREIDPQWEK